MLAGLGRLNGPFGMEVIGQRDVDGLDIWVGQELIVGAI